MILVLPQSAKPTLLKEKPVYRREQREHREKINLVLDYFRLAPNFLVENHLKTKNLSALGVLCGQKNLFQWCQN